jgi:hypothetical protein
MFRCHAFNVDGQLKTTILDNTEAPLFEPFPESSKSPALQ